MALKNWVPWSGFDGGIGTSTKKWLHGWFVNINGKDISSGVATTGELDTLAGAVAANFAPIAKGVTGGDAHDHNGGDGGTIAHGSLSSIGTNTHAQLDTHVASTANPHGVTAAQANAIPATTGAATAYVSTATESAAGIVELATTAEAQAGTDTSRAVTPAGLSAVAQAEGWGQFDDFFETNGNGDLMPSTNPISSRNFTLNTDGDIQPDAA